MFTFRKILSNIILPTALKQFKPQNFVRHASQKSNFDKKFIIVRATPYDFENVIELMRYSYFNGEPTIVAAGLSYKSNPVLENKLLESLSEGMSLIALCKRTGNIVGACINCGICPWDPDQSDVFANTCTCPKVAEVIRFFAHVTRAGNLWEKFNEHKIYEIAYVATDVSNQGNGIGYHLMKKSIELGKDLTYNVIKVDATSVFTAKICRKLGMNLVAEVPYKKYVDCDGKPVFLPPPPHNIVQVFVTLPHATQDQIHKLLIQR